jgi:uncharacterized protein YbaR (Trm112 family)
MSTDTKSTPSAGQEPPIDPAPGLDADLLRLLRCPLTRSPLRLEGDHLVATVGGLKYPIRDGIPVMLVEEAVLPEGVKSLEELKAKLGR